MPIVDADATEHVAAIAGACPQRGLGVYITGIVGTREGKVRMTATTGVVIVLALSLMVIAIWREIEERKPPT